MRILSLSPFIGKQSIGIITFDSLFKSPSKVISKYFYHSRSLSLSLPLASPSSSRQWRPSAVQLFSSSSLAVRREIRTELSSTIPFSSLLVPSSLASESQMAFSCPWSIMSIPNAKSGHKNYCQRCFSEWVQASTDRSLEPTDSETPASQA